jgi:hypothetical protein
MEHNNFIYENNNTRMVSQQKKTSTSRSAKISVVSIETLLVYDGEGL